MEDVYKRFNSYDFEKDEKFQRGSLLFDGSSTGGNGAPGLEIKLFYYNRCIEPIDSARYTQWSCGDREIECAVEPHNEVLLSSESDRAVRGQAGEGPEEGLSFTEVIRLVQAGQSVPGLGTHVDITPSNQKPTPSQMERVLKPWESR